MHADAVVTKADAHAVVVTVTSPAPTAPDWAAPLLTALRAAGWQVTLLDVSHAYSPSTFGNDNPVYRRLATQTGADYVRLPIDTAPPVMEPLGNFQSCFCDRWLRTAAPALVVAEMRAGVLFHALNARCMGLAYDAATFVLIASGTTRQDFEAREVLAPDPVLLTQEFMERAGAAAADRVLTPDTAAADWLHARGWTLPPAAGWPPDGEWPPRPAERAPPPAPRDMGEECPLVSVCLVHHERPRYLQQAVDSLLAQTYPNLEVVLVDDGSRTPEALAALAALEATFRGRDWKIIRQPNAYLGAARNRAAREAAGEWLLFMDDDNVARPDEVAVLVRAARRTGAGIVTCFHDAFVGEAPPAAPELAHYRMAFTGGPVAAGVFTNVFGDANALVRRADFERVGGFTELRGVGAEDHEFFARAVLGGVRLVVVPEPLYGYRVSPAGMRLAGSEYRNARRALTPFLYKVSPELAPLLELAPGARLQHLDDIATIDRLERELKQTRAQRDRTLGWRIRRGLARLRGRQSQ